MLKTKPGNIEHIKVTAFHWIEPWYVVYGLFGAVVAGLIPILLPLSTGKGGNAVQVGAVMAAISLGGLVAPWWGIVTDRHRMHRFVLVLGLFLTAAGLAAFAFTRDPFLWLGLALLISIGAAGASTVANLFIVEAHPKSEWDERIGWLQTFYGLGQVIGLLLAGYLSTIDLQIGLLTSAGLSILAVVLGWLMTKTPATSLEEKPTLLHAARHAEATIHSPQRSYHLNFKSMQQIGPALRSRFGLFLFIWLLTFTGAAAVFSQYPLLMRNVFNVAPNSSSIAFAGMAAVGLLLYTPAGKWSERFGAARILRVSFIIRILAFVSLFGLGFTRFGFNGWLALLAFAFVVFAWSLMSVSSTDLAARLSPVGKGEGMGIFNAVTALAGVIGALAGGWVAGVWGYGTLSLVAAVGVIFGLLLSLINNKKES
jgi:DHA1 family tetracycline resistance protein-like MFS transporter